MHRQQRITKLLVDRFSPVQIAVEDESARHAGHAGARPEGETHFYVRLVADAFQGVSRVARHRLVQQALQEEFDGGLHALQLTLLSPEEMADRADA